MSHQLLMLLVSPLFEQLDHQSSRAERGRASSHMLQTMSLRAPIQASCTQPRPNLALAPLHIVTGTHMPWGGTYCTAQLPRWAASTSAPGYFSVCPHSSPMCMHVGHASNPALPQSLDSDLCFPCCSSQCSLSAGGGCVLHLSPALVHHGSSWHHQHWVLLCKGGQGVQRYLQRGWGSQLTSARSRWHCGPCNRSFGEEQGHAGAFLLVLWLLSSFS